MVAPNRSRTSSIICQLRRAPPAPLFGLLWSLLLLLIIILCSGLSRQVDAQAISLHQPESDDRLRFVRPPNYLPVRHRHGRHRHLQTPAQPQQSQSQSQPQPPGSPTGRQRLHQARPGHVIVHFGRDHDIHRLQYVLRDGRLATLYERPAGQVAARAQSAGRGQEEPPSSLASPSAAPTESPPAAQDHQDLPKLVGVGAAGQSQPQPAPPTNEHSIDITDDKLRLVGQLLGDRHATFELPGELLQVTGQGGDIIIDKSGLAMGLAAAAGGPASSSNADTNLKILSTIAHDVIHEGIQVGEAKLKKKVDGMKAKLGVKMRELPHLIRKKLRSKSSLGMFFIDQANQQQHQQQQHLQLPQQTLKEDHLHPHNQAIVVQHDDNNGNIQVKTIQQQQQQLIS